MMAAEKWAEIAGAIEGWIAGVPEKTAVGGGQGVGLKPFAKGAGDSQGLSLARRPQAAAAACSSSAISIFPIFSIAAMTRCDFSRSGSPISS